MRVLLQSPLPRGAETAQSPRLRKSRRAAAFLCVLGAPLGLAALTTGFQSHSWWLVAAVPIGLYFVYALGIVGFFPARSATPAVPQADISETNLQASTPPRKSRGDPDWLLLVRGLACGLVYVMHTGIAFHHDFTFSHRPWAWIVQSPAWLGMALFFTLSGYLMGKGFYTRKYDLSRSGVTLYLRNRFLRIYPLMFAVALMAVTWQAPQMFSTPQVDVKLALFGYNSTDGTETVGAFWSLSTEWQYYLLVPVCYVIALGAPRLLRSNPKWMLPLATLLVLGVGISVRLYMWAHHGLIAGWAPYIYLNLFGNIDIFLLGFLANWWVPRLSRHARFLRPGWPVLLVAIYLAYSFISYEVMTSGSLQASLRWWPVFALLLPGMTALALIPVLVGCEVSNQHTRKRDVPRRRTAFVLFWVGALTYPVYLVHSSVLDAVSHGLPHANYAVKWLIGTAVVVLIAWILHMTVERAALEWRKSHTARPDV